MPKGQDEATPPKQTKKKNFFSIEKQTEVYTNYNESIENIIRAIKTINMIEIKKTIVNHT